MARPKSNKPPKEKMLLTIDGDSKAKLKAVADIAGKSMSQLVQDFAEAEFLKIFGSANAGTVERPPITATVPLVATPAEKENECRLEDETEFQEQVHFDDVVTEPQKEEIEEEEEREEYQTKIDKKYENTAKVVEIIEKELEIRKYYFETEMIEMSREMLVILLAYNQKEPKVLEKCCERTMKKMSKENQEYKYFDFCNKIRLSIWEEYNCAKKLNTLHECIRLQQKKMKEACRN